MAHFKMSLGSIQAERYDSKSPVTLLVNNKDGIILNFRMLVL